MSFADNEKDLENNQAETADEETKGAEDEALGADLAKLQATIAELQDKLLRSHAEQDNLRRRMERDLSRAISYANEEFAKDLIEVMENFHRALDSFPSDKLKDNELLQTLFSGIEMIKKSLEAVFKKHHIERISPKEGEAFDHNFHQAVAKAPSADYKSGTILQVLQAGYKLSDRLIRPASVIVVE